MKKLIKNTAVTATIVAGLVVSMGASAHVYCNGHRCYNERHALNHYNYEKRKTKAIGQRRAKRALMNGHPERALEIMNKTDKKVRRINRHKRYVRNHSF